MGPFFGPIFGPPFLFAIYDYVSNCSFGPFFGPEYEFLVQFIWKVNPTCRTGILQTLFWTKNWTLS